MAAVVAGIFQSKQRKQRTPKRNRDKTWWTYGYQNWDDVEFKKRMGATRETFEYLLQIVYDEIVKKPTNMDPNPTPPDRQLAMTLYRLTHRTSFSSTVGDSFGVQLQTPPVLVLSSFWHGYLFSRLFCFSS